jgi:hypothetical protein
MIACRLPGWMSPVFRTEPAVISRNVRPFRASPTVTALTTAVTSQLNRKARRAGKGFLR